VWVTVRLLVKSALVLLQLLGSLDSLLLLLLSLSCWCCSCYHVDETLLA
jgi:hypothetical protein